MMAGFGSGMGLAGSLGFITWVVWLAVGVLLCVYLWKKISKD